MDIVLPTEAADSYYMNKNKHYIDDFIFIEQEWYDKLFDSNIFYILGAKGSGKTLYAAYMCAEKRRNTKSKAHTIDVGDSISAKMWIALLCGAPFGYLIVLNHTIGITFPVKFMVPTSSTMGFPVEYRNVFLYPILSLFPQFIIYFKESLCYTKSAI